MVLAGVSMVAVAGEGSSGDWEGAADAVGRPKRTSRRSGQLSGLEWPRPDLPSGPGFAEDEGCSLTSLCSRHWPYQGKPERRRGSPEHTMYSQTLLNYLLAVMRPPSSEHAAHDVPATSRTRDPLPVLYPVSVSPPLLVPATVSLPLPPFPGQGGLSRGCLWRGRGRIPVLMSVLLPRRDRGQWRLLLPRKIQCDLQSRSRRVCPFPHRGRNWGRRCKVRPLHPDVVRPRRGQETGLLLLLLRNLTGSDLGLLYHSLLLTMIVIEVSIRIRRWYCRRLRRRPDQDPRERFRGRDVSIRLHRKPRPGEDGDSGLLLCLLTDCIVNDNEHDEKDT